ncbi:MAG: c-type cytochrome, partial [Planctomycetia bacterium]|nr:c-type cytochrome [Planctomycetia bacterium]
SYARYIINVTRDFCQQLTEDESRMVLMQGHKWPNAALGALYKVPQDLDEHMLGTLISLDGKLAPLKGDSIQRLQVGILAVMARSGDAGSIAYLRKVFDESPERRQAAVLGLAQQPAENWEYLVKSMPLLEPAAAREICAKLTNVDRNPDDAEPYRQAILLGLKMLKKEPEKEGSAANSIGLLMYWTGQELAVGESEEKQLAAWQKWFAEKFPAGLEPKLPVASENTKYTMDELVEYLGSDQADGVATRGAEIFVKAQCAKCHRFDGRGDSLGPDLTTVSSRFTRKELVESIVHPSHVISSQYVSKTVRTTDGRTLTGLVAPGASGETIVVLPSAVEGTKPSKLSAMPDGLLDPLSLDEVADLFAYLQRSNKGTSLTRRPIEVAPK